MWMTTLRGQRQVHGAMRDALAAWVVTEVETPPVSRRPSWSLPCLLCSLHKVLAENNFVPVQYQPRMYDQRKHPSPNSSFLRLSQDLKRRCSGTEKGLNATLRPLLSNQWMNRLLLLLRPFYLVAMRQVHA